MNICIEYYVGVYPYSRRYCDICDELFIYSMKRPRVYYV